MVPLDLRRLVPGERVQHELLVLDRRERRQAGDEPYVVLVFGNASGRLESAPVWADKIHWADGAERGRVVQVIGDVSEYRGRRQIRLTSPLRVIPAEEVRVDNF